MLKLKILFLLFIPCILCVFCSCNDLRDKRNQNQRFMFQVEKDSKVFELSQYYVMQVNTLDSDIISVFVVPKYYYEDIRTEWSEPEDIVTIDRLFFEKIIEQISQMKMFGAFEDKCEGGIISNCKETFIQKYSKAIIVQQRVSDLRMQEKQGEIHSFQVFYFRPITGVVLGKHKYSDTLMKIKIDNDWYWADRKSFDELTINEKDSVIAAGPIKDTWGTSVDLGNLNLSTSNPD